MVASLRLGLSLAGSSANPEQLVALATLAERLGFSSVWTSEAYGHDAVTPLAFVASCTSTIRLGTGIMQLPGRTPAMSAMTALTLSALSHGRFNLGLGLSGPRVAEGWHGVPASAPLQRSREYVDIVRQVIDGAAPVTLAGRCYQLPYRGEDATGMGAPLKSTLRPSAEIPIYLAAIGPKNMALAVEIADGVMPIMWSPANWREAYGPVLDPAPEHFDVAPTVWTAFGDDLQACRNRVREHIAFYIGAMGAIGKNFYADLITRYGHEATVAQVAAAYADGRRDEAAVHVPDSLVDELGLVGPREHVADQLDVWRDSPVGTLIVDTQDPAALEMLAELIL